jgi:hypothetical protein
MKNGALLFSLFLQFGMAPAEMSHAELQQVAEINFMRTKPKEYAHVLKNALNNSILDSVSKWILSNELIPLFDTMAPLPALAPSEELRNYAELFKGYDSIRGNMWHDLSYYDLPSKWKAGGQNLVMAAQPNPRAQILSLMIDDCYKNRSHRVIFLHPVFTHISVRIIRLWGSDDKPFGSLYVVVYDLRSTEDNAVQFLKKDYPVSLRCTESKPVLEVLSELKTRQ